jgi:hypothetical protein
MLEQVHAIEALSYAEAAVRNEISLASLAFVESAFGLLHFFIALRALHLQNLHFQAPPSNS